MGELFHSRCWGSFDAKVESDGCVQYQHGKKCRDDQNYVKTCIVKQSQNARSGTQKKRKDLIIPSFKRSERILLAHLGNKLLVISDSKKNFQRLGTIRI